MIFFYLQLRSRYRGTYKTKDNTKNKNSIDKKPVEVKAAESLQDNSVDDIEEESAVEKTRKLKEFGKQMKVSTNQGCGSGSGIF